MRNHHSSRDEDLSGENLSLKPNLFIQTAFLGDLCLSVPLLKRMRQLWPHQPTYAIVREGLGSFLLSTGLINFSWEVKKGDWSSYQDILDEIRKETLSFHRLISAHSSWRTARLVKKIPAQYKTGYRTWWNRWVYPIGVVKDPGAHEVLRQLSLLGGENLFSKELSMNAPCGSLIEGRSKKDQKGSEEISLDLKERYQNRWEDLSPQLRKILMTEEFRRNSFLLVFPGSVWATKQWPLEGFIQISQRIWREQGWSILVMGGKSEESLGERIRDSLPPGFVVNLAGKTSLEESLILMSQPQIRGLVTNDSGGQHLGALVSLPTVSIFGPTVPSQGFSPWNPRALIVENREVSCRPCGPHGHHQCPRHRRPEENHRCMRSIRADQVYTALGLLMGW